MTTALKFRNVSASPDDPVESWCYRPRYLHIRRQRFMRTDWQRSMSTA